MQGTGRTRDALTLVLKSRLVHVPELQRGMDFSGAREKAAGLLIHAGAALVDEWRFDNPTDLTEATAGNTLLGICSWRKGRKRQGWAEFMV